MATDIDDQQTRLEDIQHLLGHSAPRTTKVYIRNQQKVTRNLVERIRAIRCCVRHLRWKRDRLYRASRRLLARCCWKPP